jgi:hypothetical protein
MINGVGSSRMGVRAGVRCHAFLRGGAGLGLAVAALIVAGCAEEFNRSPQTRTEFASYLRGPTEGEPGRGPANGALQATYDSNTHVLAWQVKWTRLKGADPQVQFDRPLMAESTMDGLKGSNRLTAHQADDLLKGRLHINVMTSQFPLGEVRGRIHRDANQPDPGRTAMTAILLGSKEPHPSNSAGSARLTGSYSPATRTFTWELHQVSLTGEPIGSLLEGDLEATRIGGNGMSGRLTLSDVDERALMLGAWGVKVATKAYPLGEIRGELVPQE